MIAEGYQKAIAMSHVTECGHLFFRTGYSESIQVDLKRGILFTESSKGALNLESPNAPECHKKTVIYHMPTSYTYKLYTEYIKLNISNYLQNVMFLTKAD